MSTLLDVNNDNDLVKMLLLKSILSTEREAEDYFKNISKVNDAELIDNSNICIKDQINILQKKCQNKNDFMECNIENCNDMLQFNEQIISLLLDLKRHITSALQECERKLTIIERSLQKYMVGDTKVLICNPGMPYFKDKHYFFASNNEDEILKENHKELQLRNLPKFSPWTEKERNVLLKAIRKEPIMDVLCTQKIKCSKIDNGMLKLKGKIDKSRKATTQFSSTDFLELINPLQKREFDWFKISSTYFEDIHSPLDCHVMWNVFLHAKINKNYWTKSEDAKLKEIVKKCKFQNWDKIAKDLNTGRTAYQCFIRYNTTKKLPKIKNCTWENEEDKRLSKLIEIFKIGDFIPWGEIANWTLNRTKQQIYFRWTYSLAPYLIKGRFTKMEDKILKNAITLYGTNFRKISAAMMPNRSTVQLHDRYQTLSTNQIANWNLWTLEEDTKLLNFFEHIGPNWSMIAKEFSCKTRTQLRHRYTALQKYIKREKMTLHKQFFNSESNRNNSSDIMFKKMASTDHSDVDASSFENINNNPQHVKLQSKCYKKLCIQTINQGNILFNNFEKKYFPSIFNSEVTQIYNIPIMYATRATLLSFKNLMYLKRLNEKDNNSSKSFIQSPEFQKMFNLLESRIEQLFKYPIGLSKTVLPEVYVMDTFSYNDITSKRKISETLD
ncbi:Myb-like protein L [Eufriesea mexicana]|uniref:Myb-like protein L n=1 Tax=Eufriesea mexicana TaxID=516756 RepID=A0A310SBT7_9HYME|nr:Myb-like protein L [Eufriesea mexicana]